MTDIINQVALLVRETRKEKGLTQKELGEKIGVSESTVNGYENGKNNITVGKLQQIFQALNEEVMLVKKT